MRTFAVGVAESEVDEADGAIVVDEEVLWLEVSVDDVEFVDVLDAGDDLLEDAAGLLLGYSAWEGLYFLHLTM